MGSGVRRPRGRAVFEGLLSAQPRLLAAAYQFRRQKYYKFASPPNKRTRKSPKIGYFRLMPANRTPHNPTNPALPLCVTSLDCISSSGTSHRISDTSTSRISAHSNPTIPVPLLVLYLLYEPTLLYSLSVLVSYTPPFLILLLGPPENGIFWGKRKHRSPFDLAARYRLAIRLLNAPSRLHVLFVSSFNYLSPLFAVHLSALFRRAFFVLPRL